MSRLTRNGTAEPVSRDQILRHARGQGNIHFPCSAEHEQDWQPYPVDPYSAICHDHTYINTYIVDPMLLPSGNPIKCHDEFLSLQPMFPPKRLLSGLLPVIQDSLNSRRLQRTLSDVLLISPSRHRKVAAV